MGSDSEDVPLAQKARVKAERGETSKAKVAGKKRKKVEKAKGPKASKQIARAAKGKRPKPKRGGAKKPDGPKKEKNQMWATLEHNGVVFAPEYEPHGVKILYEGRPVGLTPEQEEMATEFAKKLESDYMGKATFLNNFWARFKTVLGPDHAVKALDKIDFRPIYNHIKAEREKRNNLPKEAKKALKAQKDAEEAKYKFCTVDGKQEQVGNFRIEPPGLFLGRGEHPKMGMWKRRIMPEDVIINIGEGAKVPEVPLPGHRWKEVRHDTTVTWLASWKDPVDMKGVKYVMLAANSTWKAESDREKYERARKLKDLIGVIRTDYAAMLASPDTRLRQVAVAIYLIDRLALRAGHEKDEDEADTVGCCNLKAGHVIVLEVDQEELAAAKRGEEVEGGSPYRIKLDFLGKDSMRYENTVRVPKGVYDAMGVFTRKMDNGKGRAKTAEDPLFDDMDAGHVNDFTRKYMEGLSAKVFRTYNASVVLDELLWKLQEGTPGYANSIVEKKKADYDSANKDVAILCNHQRSVPKTHAAGVEKMRDKIGELRADCKDLEAQKKAAKRGQHEAWGAGQKWGGEDKAKKVPTVESLDKKLDATRARVRKIEVQLASKEELKQVALGTSKINYMDPRITIAWCKRNEVPIEKVFNKSLLTKFFWCMDVEPGFKW